ncbi:MAG: dTDP-4-dehydrorhamnose 3,5-epimerase [Chitinophagaceae bacterium]|jgi:dTDP-4-dehydrorhamnose 3,5-epimerase
MPFHQTELPGLMIFEPNVIPDKRGYFFESYHQRIFAEAGQAYDWVQDNQSHSAYGVVRGLHYQHDPFSQAKLVRVLQGTIWDVAVDIRKGSPTFGKVFGIELSAENKLQLIIPRGFAHGFSVLSETVEMLYKCDNYYHKQSEGSIIWNDPDLNIDWKVPADKVIISEKDMNHPAMKDAIHNFSYHG